MAASAEVTRRVLDDGDDRPLDVVVRCAQRGTRADFATLALRAGARHLIVRAAIGALVEPLLGTLVDARQAGNPLLAEVGECITAPLFAGRETVGLLSVGRLPGRPSFTMADSDHLAGFANHAGAALELDRMRTERGGAQLGDHVIHELFALCMGLQGLVPAQARPEHRTRLAGYVNRLDALVRRVRSAVAGDRPNHGETLAQRLLSIVEDESVAGGLPVHIQFDGKLDLSAERSDRVVSVVRDGLCKVAHRADVSSALLRVSALDGFVIVDGDSRFTWSAWVR